MLPPPGQSCIPSVRKGGVLDLPTMRDVVASACETDGIWGLGSSPVVGWMPGTGDTLQRVLPWLPRPDRPFGHVWIAESGGQVAGFLRILAANRPRTRWHVEALAVRASSASEGVAAALLDHIVAHYGPRGAAALTLHCNALQADMLSLCRSRGFRAYAKVACHLAPIEVVQQAVPVPPPAGWRRLRGGSDRQAIQELERATTPAPIRWIDSHRPEVFGSREDRPFPGPLQAPWRDVEALSWVVEVPDHGVVAHLRLLARLRGDGPHMLQLTVHPGWVPLYGEILHHALGRLRGYPQAPALIGVASHHPAKREACLEAGMRLVTEDVCLVRDTVRTLVVPRDAATPRRLAGLAPALRMERVPRG